MTLTRFSPILENYSYIKTYCVGSAKGTKKRKSLCLESKIYNLSCLRYVVFRRTRYEIACHNITYYDASSTSQINVATGFFKSRIFYKTLYDVADTSYVLSQIRQIMFHFIKLRNSATSCYVFVTSLYDVTYTSSAPSQLCHITM